jgi:ABC-type uncharacterized transport system ATPase subunit
VHTLSVGEMQRVEIIRALLTNPKLLILDEPTSVLTPQAVEKLFVVLRKLASEGCSILYISHKLHEIRALCTACTVLRGGKVTGVCNPRQESNASLSRLMIGAEPPALEHRAGASRRHGAARAGPELPRADQFGVDLIDLEFEVRAGEVVGIAGVSGNGQRSCCTRCRAKTSGPRRPASRSQARTRGAWARGQRRALGLHFVPEERLGRGAVPTMGLAHNLLLTRTEASAAAAGSAWGRCKSRRGHHPSASMSRPVAPCGGQVAVGRQPAKVHRGARDRRQPQAAHRLAAHLGRGRGRGRADSRRDPGAARCGLRRAGGQRGAGRIV